MSPKILFTHLKIILLQYFQFSTTISSIQTDPKKFQIQIGKRLCDQKKKKKIMIILDEKATSQCQTTRWGRRHFHQKLKWVFFFFCKISFVFVSLIFIFSIYKFTENITIFYFGQNSSPVLGACLDSKSAFPAVFCSPPFFFFARFGVLQLLFNKQ